MEAWKLAVLGAIAENEGLKGDDCKSSRQFLLGFAGVLFERQTNRFMTDEEEEGMVGEISKFLETDVNKSIRLLDKVLNIFVVGDPDLEGSNCECCEEKRQLLKELREAGLVKW